MNNLYDVVVVGAGNAGLSSALHLAKAGKKVLLIEQHNLPGGCATSFVRGRFEFEPSLHELCDIGTAEDPGEIRAMMEDLGVHVDWRPVPDCFRIISKYTDGSHMDVSMPFGKENFIAKMDYYVPGSRAKMEEYFELLEETMAGTAYISASNGHADSNVLKEKYPNLLRTGSYPVKKVWNAMKIPAKCQDIMSTYWGYLGIDMEHMAFIHYCNMFMKYVTRAAYIPTHTSHEISCAMIERLRELGGDIWFNCRAEEFLFDGDKVCGVRTSLGDVECEQVLANINPDIIDAKMIPKDMVPERDKKLSAARNKKFSTKFCMIYMALNKTVEELGLKDYCVFFSETADSRKEYEYMKSIDNDYNILISYNNLIPDFSPEGTCVISFTKLFSESDDWAKLTPENYYKVKDKMIAKCIDDMKKNLGIDVEPYIEEVEVATPMTFARYLGTPDGTPYGFEVSDWDGIIARMMNIEADFTIKGLRHIGAGSFMADGYSSTWINGDLTATLACKELEEGGTK